MDGDTWHRYRLNAGPWEAPPFLLEPYNPPYYLALWEENGFALLDRYFSQRVDATAVVAHCAGRAEQALALGYRLRPLDLGRFEDELRTLYRLSIAIFAGNYLYSPIEGASWPSPRSRPSIRAWSGLRPRRRGERRGGRGGRLSPTPTGCGPSQQCAGGGTRWPSSGFRHRDDFEAIDPRPWGPRRTPKVGGGGGVVHRGHVEALAMGKKPAYHCLLGRGILRGI
jgi:hypothetical protein